MTKPLIDAKINNIAPNEATLTVEIAYALLNKQYLVAFSLPSESTVQDALMHMQKHRGIPPLNNTKLDTLSVGIFSKLCTLNTLLHTGDRIEIYRDLLADPKEIRRQRVDSERSAIRRQKLQASQAQALANKQAMTNLHNDANSS